MEIVIPNSVVAIPNSAISIEDYAFENCSGLEQIFISSAVASIGYCTFSGCDKLQTSGTDGIGGIEWAVPHVVVGKDGITIMNQLHRPVCVYGVNGQLFYQKRSYNSETIALSPGIYLDKTAQCSTKIKL